MKTALPIAIILLIVASHCLPAPWGFPVSAAAGAILAMVDLYRTHATIDRRLEAEETARRVGGLRRG